MKIIIAPDSFKGSMSAMDAAKAIETGVKRVLPDAETILMPIADGGEGTVKTIHSIVGGKLEKVSVIDPLGYCVEAEYCVTKDGSAIMEMAAASGLTLTPERERNVMKSSSYGTGQMIKDALDKGCKKIYIGIGGSATNDGGTGMAQALGVCFIGDKWRLLSGSGANLALMRTIDATMLDKRLPGTEVTVLCDVDNPLYGPNGASQVYGPQKGASPDEVELLDQGMKIYDALLKRDVKADVSDIPGSGAAGGMGAALMAFCGAKLVSGVDAVLDLYGFDEKVKDADLVITGEGKTDQSSLNGKAPSGIAARAKKAGVKTALVSGIINCGGCELQSLGVVAAVSVTGGEVSAEMSMAHAPVYAANAAEELMNSLLPHIDK